MSDVLVEPYVPERVRRRRPPDWAGWPLALSVLAAAAYSTLAVARYERFATRSWDLAIFEQAIRAYAHLQAPIVDIKGPGFNLLGDHFHPILVLLAPFYRVFPSPVTLLVAQGVLIALSVLVVAHTAVQLLGRGRGLCIGLAYALSWGIQSAVDVDFHEVCFAPVLIALSLRAYLHGRWWAAAAWSVPLVLVKEDLGATVAVLGLLIAWRGSRLVGALLACFGVAAFWLTTYVVLPALNPRGTYDYWSKLGEGQRPAGGLLGKALSLPAHLFVPDVKTETLLLLAAVTGFFALRSPLVALVLPTLGWRFLSDNAGYWDTTWHYSLVLMPIVFMALLDAFPRPARWGWLRVYAVHVPAVVLAVALVLCMRFPLRDLVRPETYAASPRAPYAHAALAHIPDGASVESDSGLMPQLAGRTTLYWIGGAPAIRPDYVVVDAQAGWSPAPPADLVSYAASLHPGSGFELVYNEGGYSVLRRL